jgi:diguanylate cyclase (GGDEF)-like protein/PAS domain S-box-containing protein
MQVGDKMHVTVFIVLFFFVIFDLLLLFLTLKYKQRGKTFEEEVQFLKEQYKSVIDSANDGIIVIDHQSKIKSWNKGAECIFQFRESEALGKDLFIIIPEEYRKPHTKGVHQFLSTQNPKIIGQTIELSGLKKDGTEIPIELSVSSWKINDKIYFGGIIRDISGRKQAEEKINFLAFNDELTKLPNRRYFDQLLEKELHSAKGKGESFVLMLLDLDRFKYVNDTFGHSVGDLLLKEIAHRLNNVLGNKGIVARMGGDEFTLLMPNVQSVNEVSEMAEKILSIVKKTIEINKNEIFITTSIGIVQYPVDGDDSQTLMIKADQAMYSAKEKGKSTYEFYSSSVKLG